MSSNKENRTQFVSSPKEMKKNEKKFKKSIGKFLKSITDRVTAKVKIPKQSHAVGPYKKEVKNLWRECRQTIIGGVTAAALVVSVCVAVNHFQLKLGYEVIVDGQNIGMVTEKQTVYSAIDKVRQDVKFFFGNEEKYEKNPAFVRRIVSGKELADVESLRNALLANVDCLVEGYGVHIDGKLVFGLSSEEAAELVLDSYKKKYAGETTGDMKVAFCQDVQVKKGYLTVGMLETPEGALKLLVSDENSPMLSVKTVQTVASIEPIPYETEEVEDSEVYRGRRVVAQKGKDGEAKVTALVTKVNGVETKKEVLKTETVSEPVTQIEKTGTKTPPPTTGSGEFVNPTHGILTSRYGARWSRQHKGIDVAGPVGTPIKAADGGVVTYAGWMDGYGNYVIIDHENGYKTAYAHCSSLGVAVGARVLKGEEIAKMGSTGRSTGSHLHFEVMLNGQHINPLDFVGY